MSFADLLTLPLHFILDPSKRIFFVYFLTSLLIALTVLSLQSGSVIKSIRGLFHPKIWFHPSARLDFLLMGFNTVLKTTLWISVFMSSLEFARWVLRGLDRLFPDFWGAGLSYSILVFAFTVTHFVALDFMRFLQHYAFHKVPWLWRFHQIHHSAQVLTPITLYRTHPVESLVNALLRTIVSGTISGVFIFLSQGKIDAYAILGVNAIDFIFNLLGSNLRHSHVWMSFGPLNYLLVSPSQHQVHHSRDPRHFDKNLGFALSLWDLWFGTFYWAHKKEFLVFGVRGESNHSMVHALLSPFKQGLNNPESVLIKDNHAILSMTQPELSVDLQVVVR